MQRYTQLFINTVLLLQVTGGKQNYSLITGIQGYKTLNSRLIAEKYGLKTFS